jgi:hypothetical protein
MPTYDVLASFWRDWRNLTARQQLAFRHAVEQLVADLDTGTSGLAGELSASRATPVSGR